MKKWAFLFGAAAATGAAAVLVSIAIRRAQEDSTRQQVPDILADCFERVHSIERELHRLRPAPESIT
jgi:hypothetical protein